MNYTFYHYNNLFSISLKFFIKKILQYQNLKPFILCIVLSEYLSNSKKLPRVMFFLSSSNAFTKGDCLKLHSLQKSSIKFSLSRNFIKPMNPSELYANLLYKNEFLIFFLISIIFIIVYFQFF